MRSEEESATAGFEPPNPHATSALTALRNAEENPPTRCLPAIDYRSVTPNAAVPRRAAAAGCSSLPLDTRSGTRSSRFVMWILGENIGASGMGIIDIE